MAENFPNLMKNINSQVQKPDRYIYMEKSQEIYILNKTIINEWVQQGHMIQIKT